jgi:hypothetical protein
MLAECHEHFWLQLLKLTFIHVSHCCVCVEYLYELSYNRTLLKDYDKKDHVYMSAFYMFTLKFHENQYFLWAM